MIRPKRRASQNFKHFFRHQLADDPLKVEEEDLKHAISASLQLSKDARGVGAGGGSKRAAARRAKEIIKSATQRRAESGAECRLETGDFVTTICYSNLLPRSMPRTSDRSTRPDNSEAGSIYLDSSSDAASNNSDSVGDSEVNNNNNNMHDGDKKHAAAGSQSR